MSVESLLLSVTRNPRIPLALRRRLGAWFISMDGRSFTLSLNGRPYKGRLDNYVEWMVYITQCHFEYTYLNLLFGLVRGGVVLDIGANVGNHSHAFSSFFDEVHAFEPYGLVADRLQEKAAELPNVSLHRIALSSEPGTLRFSAPVTNNLGTGHIDEAGEIDVQVMQADSYVDSLTQQAIKLVKIDVEGHEKEVLMGMPNLLDKHRPMVMFEVPKAIAKSAEGISELFSLFPGEYQFLGIRGQTSFPAQQLTPKVCPINRNIPRLPKRFAYLLAYTPDHSVQVKRDRVVSNYD